MKDRWTGDQRLDSARSPHPGFQDSRIPGFVEAHGMDEEGRDRPCNGPREAPAVMAGPGSGDRAEQFGQGVAMGTVGTVRHRKINRSQWKWKKSTSSDDSRSIHPRWRMRNLSIKSRSPRYLRTRSSDAGRTDHDSSPGAVQYTISSPQYGVHVSTCINQYRPLDPSERRCRIGESDQTINDAEGQYCKYGVRYKQYLRPVLAIIPVISLLSLGRHVGTRRSLYGTWCDIPGTVRWMWMYCTEVQYWTCGTVHTVHTVVPACTPMV